MDPYTARPPDFRSVRRKGARSSARPSADALAQLQYFADRSKRKKAAAFPLDFVRDERAERGPTLAWVLRGGRGGAVRLKLLLSMHLLAAKTPYDIRRSPVSWATMLDLPDPGDNGARRVRDALNWLDRHHLIRTERSRGQIPICYLLSIRGDGTEFSRPTPGDGYIQMPLAFWRNGWIDTLSGTALAMWLVVRDLHGGRVHEPAWVSPSVARARYRFSEETFSKGVRELAANQLVTVKRVPQGAERWQYNRLRNTYRLNLDRLNDTPS